MDSDIPEHLYPYLYQLFGCERCQLCCPERVKTDLQAYSYDISELILGKCNADLKDICGPNMARPMRIRKQAVILAANNGLKELLPLIESMDKTGIEKEISYAIMPYDQLKACAERFVADPRQWNKKHFYATWEEDIEHEATLDTPVKKADTLEELGVLIGADPKVFVDEIKKYNSFCEKGVDEDFGKDPKFLIPIPLDKGPYYAVYGQRFSEAAMGGVTVNEKTQVLRNDGSIIPGLYAGGDCTSAMHRKGELAPLSELTWAMASAYTSGGEAAAYADAQ